MTFWTPSVSTFAVAALTALPLAAQSTSEATETQPQSVMEVEDDSGIAVEEADDMAQGKAPTEPASPVEGTIVMQDQNSVLASDLIGATVENREGAEIGDINDMIVSIEGDVEGVVIGVGGFLGIGEKDVAIDIATFEFQNTGTDAPRLVLDTTSDELKAADEFVTAAEQRQEQQVKDNQATGYDGSTASQSSDPATSN
jgi:sporulation protein YlmC with PRC-barrel domain